MSSVTRNPLSVSGLESGERSTYTEEVTASRRRSQIKHHGDPLPREKVSRRFISFRAATALAIVIVTALLIPWKAFRSQSVHDTRERIATALPTVKVERPSLAATSNVVLPATIRPWQTTTLHSRVTGYLTAWYKDLGDDVKAGELLASIEAPELDQELAEGDALAIEAAAAAVQARAERQEAEAEVKVAEAQLNRVQVEADLAVSLLARREKLLTTNAISQEEFDTFQKQLEARRADVAAAESDVTRRRKNLATRAAGIEAREAMAKSRQANVERLKELQSFKRIVAPFDGVVTSRSSEVGMLVTAGKESLFTVEDMHRVRVQLNVPQAYAEQTGPGVSATVSIPESASQLANGIITRVARSVDAGTRTMLAEIELENDARRLQPGTYVQVTLAFSLNSLAWMIPTNTLQMNVEGPHVAVVNNQDQVEIKRVNLGRDLGGRIVVVDGIEGDERLVVNPSEGLRTGAHVQVVDSSELLKTIAQSRVESR